MRSNYKKLGSYIREVSEKNKDLRVEKLLGVSITKVFIPSIANIVGTDMSKYKIVRKGQFAYGPVTSRNGEKISVALLNQPDCIISTSYIVFEIIDHEQLDSEYLMMWFSRPEFDRDARYMSHGSVREIFGWEEMCDIELSIRSIEKQREIVREYNVIMDQINLNERLNQKLEETAQAIYKHWFVDFEFPISTEYAASVDKPELEGKPYKSSGGDVVFRKELGHEAPATWGIKEINKLATMKYGKMLDSCLFLDRGYPVFSGYGIRGYYTEYMYEAPQILVLCRGVSGTGEVRMSPPFSHITNLSIVVENHEEEIDKYFLYYFLKNQNLRALDSGSAASQITIGDLGKYFVLVPSNNYQNQFNDRVRKISAYSLHNENQISKLDGLKDVLLSRISVPSLVEDIAV